jgi:GT2 family glycosyltransferase
VQSTSPGRSDALEGEKPPGAPFGDKREPDRAIAQTRTAGKTDLSLLGIVVIGRNEGERLRACLGSVMAREMPVVYVDSGSVDGSVPLAASMGATVLELDPARQFSAARARNEGFDRLMEQAPHLHYVQFVDGDCEAIDGWFERGVAQLDARPEVVIVCGRLLEKHPEASIYNRLCSLEWQKPAGIIPSCGGIFMIRAESFRAVAGFRPEVVAGEEADLCLRLRRLGGQILHVDVEMARHDAAMLRFSQWWLRARRAGHAYAQGADINGKSEDRLFVRDCRRIWFWGLIVPLLSLAPAWPTRGISVFLLAAYPLLALRIYINGRRRGWSGPDARLYAVFSVLAKFPGLLGLLQYHLRRRRGMKMTIIEHKQVGTPR